MIHSNTMILIHQFTLLFILFVSSLPSNCLSKREELINRLFESYDAQKAPPDQTNVRLSIKMEHLSIPNIEYPLVRMIAIFTFRWRDNRLGWNPQDYDYIRRLTLPTNMKIWKPVLSTLGEVNQHLYTRSLEFGGISLEIKDRRRYSIPTIVMKRKMEANLECSSQYYFIQDNINCTLSMISRNNLSRTSWTTVVDEKDSPFLNRTNGMNSYYVSAIQTNIQIQQLKKDKPDIVTMSVILISKISSLSFLLQIFSWTLLSLSLFTLSLQSNHTYISILVLLQAFLLHILFPKLLISIPTFSYNEIPLPVIVYTLIWLATVSTIPLLHLLSSQSLYNLYPFLLSKAENIPYFKIFHSYFIPYIIEDGTPFILLCIRVTIAIVYLLTIISLIL